MGPETRRKTAQSLSKPNEFGLPGSLAEVQAGERNGKRKTARSGAARVDVKDAVAPAGLGLVGVPADHHLKGGGPRIDVELLQIVQDVDAGSLQLQHHVFRKRLAPRLGVYVAAYRMDRRDVPEPVEDRPFANVASMNDRLGAT